MAVLDLLVPALAGYLFLRLCNLTRFGLLWESGYHVAFRSAIVGLLLHVAGSGVAEHVQGVPAWLEAVYGIAEDGAKLEPATVWSLLLGGALPWPVNVAYGRRRANRAAARRVGDFVALVLDEAMTTGRTVEVSLRDGKSYIGLVMSRPGVRQEALRVVPLISGYRQQATQKLVPTTVYARLLKRTPPREWQDLGVAIPRSEVRWARFFDFTLYPYSNRGRMEKVG